MGMLDAINVILVSIHVIFKIDQMNCSLKVPAFSPLTTKGKVINSELDVYTADV